MEDIQELLSYSAGIIDGEDWIGMGNHRSVGITVRMTEDAGITVLKQVFGGTINIQTYKNPNYSDIYNWRLFARKDVTRCLQLLNTRCRVKAPQVSLALEYLSTMKWHENDPELRNTFYLRFKKLNQTGKNNDP